jgi:RimJ/RimL family protein N-acetyltransferase
MASALLEIAASRGIERVTALTAPNRNASTRILEKLGFNRVGEALDEEIGPAWGWERTVAGSVLDGNGS